MEDTRGVYVYVGGTFVYGCGGVDACMMSVPDQSIYLRGQKKGQGKGRKKENNCPRM